MPQINQLLLVYQSQWFWLALVLAVIYFVIGRGMLPKIEATVDLRDKQIADDLAAAQRARAAADASEEAWRADQVQVRAEAQSAAAAAKAKAAKDAENRVAKADAKIAEDMAVADAALAKARNTALASVESIASEAALDIVAKVSGMKASAADAAKAVKAVLSHA
jgi:F-type H+-transporting ATPase subunit b